MENSWVEPEQREERKFRILQNVFESFFWTNQMDFRGIILIDPHNLKSFFPSLIRAGKGKSVLNTTQEGKTLGLPTEPARKFDT